MGEESKIRLENKVVVDNRRLLKEVMFKKFKCVSNPKKNGGQGWWGVGLAR